MTPLVLAVALAAGPVALWFAAYGLVLLASRPETPPAAPATEDLGPEPPAVVSLLVNHWEVTEDAAESTLLDLAARHLLELRQPGNDARQTTVHVRVPQPAGLTAYEQRVFNRVAGLAVGGTVPLTALTFRDAGQAATFARGFTAEVIAEARSHGLSQRRMGKAAVSALTAGAAIAGVCVAAAIGYWLGRSSNHDTGQAVLFAGLITFGFLSYVSGRPHGERDTTAGREAASRWLGVRAWLRGHDAFGDLPPAAVTVWDRYLSYGAAVGATRVSSAVIDLGMGSRRNVWSSFGGTWHRVRVHYPRFWPRYGKTAPRLILRAVIVGGIGFLLVRYWHRAVGAVVATQQSFAYVALIQTVGVLVGLAFLAYAVYVLIRTAVDLAAPQSVTGEVVWTEKWRTRTSQNNTTVWLHYLAVDDGAGDSTRAWALPVSASLRCNDGDTVTMTARRWSRRVVTLTVTKPGIQQRLAAADMATAAASAAILGGSASSRRGTAGVSVANLAPLLSADEVGAALGRPVTIVRANTNAVMDMTEFRGPDGHSVLRLVCSNGVVARMAMRGRKQGQELPGLGDEARGGPGWIAIRRGDTVLLLNLAGTAATSTAPATLLALAQSADAHLASQAV
jgi:hypothetical protein